MIDKNLIQIQEYQGEGYQPVIQSNGWRIAILNYTPVVQPDQITDMERHLETDEAFILLNGRGILVLGGNDSRADGLESCAMEPGKIYTILARVWHTILLSRDASVLIVENSNTGDENSEKSELHPDHYATIITLAEHYGFSK